MSTSETAGPLAGFRIADFTSFLSGPFATQILGDLGAEVIKVEPPDGDMSRTVPPSFVDGASTYFGSANRNKKSIVLDLRTAEGRLAAQRLAASADAVVENFKPGRLAHLGLDAAELRKQRPALVWASISGFGQTGPLRDRPAYDMIVQAMSGVMSLTGHPDGAPARAGTPIGDLCAGLYAVIGLLAALLEARRTGQGRDVDVSMLDVQVAMLSYQAAAYLQGGGVPGPQGSAHDAIPSYRCLRTADGQSIAVTANTPAMFRSLMKVLGMPELAEDERFTTPASRYANKAVLVELLERAFALRTAADLLPALLAADIPAAAVDSLDGVFRNPQVLERGMRQEIRGTEPGQSILVAGDPLHFAPPARQSHQFPPRLGEHTAEVLRELGCEPAPANSR